MKFDRLNQILQVAANIGVILSITFLAIELGQNQEMMRAQTRNELSQGIVGLLSTGITDPEFLTAVQKGRTGQELSSLEQNQFDRYANMLFRYWEDVHYQYRNGLFDEAEYGAQTAAIQRAMSGPGLFRFWCDRKAEYSPEFVSEINRLRPDDQC